MHYLKYRPVPCLLQLCHNCWQNCQHHPGLQIGAFHVWVFLNYALCPSFCTVQSTHPCFQWEHHHPVQKRGEKRKIDIKKNSNNNIKLILQNYSASYYSEQITMYSYPWTYRTPSSIVQTSIVLCTMPVLIHEIPSCENNKMSIRTFLKKVSKCTCTTRKMFCKLM